MENKKDISLNNYWLTATNVTPSLSCDFETEDICGWSHDLNHNFDWKRLNYRTPSGHLATGPSYDHTKGPGENGTTHNHSLHKIAYK